MKIDQGNGQLSAVGFFNPMLGGGDAVGVSGGVGGGGRSPWTFVPGQGWTNPVVQVGVSLYTDPSYFPGLDSTADGTYYLKVDVSTNRFTVTTDGSSSGDGANVCRIYIGTVADGEQTGGIYTMPIIWAYM